MFILRHVTAPPQSDLDDEPIETPGWIGLSDTTRQELEPILAYLKGREVDDLTLSAVLSTPKASRPMKQLVDIERCWQVAAMTAAGVTSKDIAARLACSRRLVMSIRADPITQLCECILRADAVATDELRAAKVESAATRGQLTESLRELARIRGQLDEILGKLMTGTLKAFPRCGHPRVEWNTYRHTDRSGPVPRPRELCRECNRLRVTKFRAKNRPAEQGGNAEAYPILQGSDS